MKGLLSDSISGRKKNKSGLLCFFLTILIGTNTFTQEKSYIFKPVAAEDELAQAWVTYSYQDFLGFLWIGTSDGLYRYDGYNFKTYRSITVDTLTLAGNNISSIYEDSENRLWVATTKGISIYNRNNDIFYYHNNWPAENYSGITDSLFCFFQ